MTASGLAIDPIGVAHPTTPAAAGTGSVVRTLLGLITALRPRQWIKNGLVFVPLAFTFNLFQPALLARSGAVFALFCALASAGYLLNDASDVEADRHHPTKRLRPIAAGLVSVRVAIALGVCLAVIGVLGCWVISPNVGVLAIGYLVLTATYTLWLKHIVLVDVFGLAAGFVLRAVAGAVALAVPISPWLYIATLLGSLLIGLGKRRVELNILGPTAHAHRKNLAGYSLELIDQLILVIASTAVMTYALYTFSAENLPRNHSMMLTIPFVLYGLCRYLLLMRAGDAGGAPEEILFRDRPLLVAVLLWAVSAVAILYVPQFLG